MNYVNDALPFLVNCLITEYDIERGNTSVMRHYGLAQDEVISRLEGLSKKDRNVQVGLMQREDKNFAKALEAAFDKAVKEIVRQNDLDMDIDVLCVRRDAIFVVNKTLQKPKIGNSILFRPKHEYHASLQIGPKLHFFFESGKPVRVDHFIQETKDTDGILEKLRPGMFDFLEEFVQVCESSNMNRRRVYEWMANFCNAYKARSLDAEYYREFNRDASFRFQDGEMTTLMDYVPDDMIDSLDISFNYVNIIIPLLQILI